MDEEYKKYCVASIKNMIDEKGKTNGNILQIYRFLIHNPQFVENNNNFKVVTMKKAKEVLSEIDEMINKSQIDSIKRKTFENVKKVLQEYQLKFPE